jgi:cation diffusion facilitator CzcD-associated flavoprotein CzcO
MSGSVSYKVLILGAGPAGLCLGRELSLRRIPYLILEKEAVVGSTFARMTESTTFGPWLNNTLPGSPVPVSRLLSRTTRADYARYLSDYATTHHLEVRTGARVASVRYTDRFLVETEAGEKYEAECLVNATGVFSKPFLPEYPGTAPPTALRAPFRS